MNDTIYGGAEQFARIIEATTAGKFKISVAGPVRLCLIRARFCSLPRRIFDLRRRSKSQPRVQENLRTVEALPQ